MSIKNLLFFAVLSFQNLIYSQKTGINAELHYPITLPGDTNNYSEVDGIIGGAFQFIFTDSEFVNYGIAYKFDSNQTYKQLENTSPTKLSFVMSHINGVLKVNLDAMQKAKIYTDAGFTFYKYHKSVGQQGFTGFNVGGGLSYDFIYQFYGQLTYNYVHAGLKQQQTNFVDNENFGIVRITLGLKI